MPKTNPKPHSFVIKDEDLFAPGRTERDLRTLVCEECGEQPGRGVHAPPPLPLHAVIAEEVAKTLSSSTLSESRALNWTQLTSPAARAAFTTIKKVRAALADMGKRDAYSDPYDMGDPFSDIDNELDGLLTQLRRIGWDQEQP